ncbi:MAG: hypothetical protein ACKOQZ_03415, partial [Actinomycetota bacterium]
ALEVEPRLGEWREKIQRASGIEPVLAGSGATWWLAGSHPGLGEKLRDARVLETSSAYLRRW